ncbi:hypothetical protein BD324DRAFT_651127 [Kockovaella imperatae]|uniref:6-phosphogluconate dehydrogenase NADP-binding domain-containing protein n=1 Tax=Kockovaella imperatae TaxID=4999 RepID=A0A1Y1UEZ5_9TREE|nr:hypothetical protein BD324DRAFT_651127 [Kockovaella imperatae]ORX36641.1 hypothetical protein BD324DRAFT_651127 [Kockovaella imperatae]
MALKIGYVGLGALGSAIAPNVAAFAHENGLEPVVFWNRSENKFTAIKDQLNGGRYASDLADVVKDCNLVLACLANDQACEEVFGAMAEALKTSNSSEKVVFVNQSTIKPITANKLKDQIEEAGGSYLTGTVFGRPDAAKARKLVVALAGDKATKDKVKPLMEFIGRYTLDAGQDCANGAALKLMGNSIILGTMQLYSEAYALGDAIGMDPKVFHELHSTLFNSPVLLPYSDKISQGKFGHAGFTVENGLKDATYILSMGEELGHPVNLPTIERARNNLSTLKDEGLGHFDWSSIASTERKNAGLPPWREGTNDGKA